MKRLMLALLVISLVAVNPAALADGGPRGGSGGHGGSGSWQGGGHGGGWQGGGYNGGWHGGGYNGGWHGGNAWHGYGRPAGYAYGHGWYGYRGYPAAYRYAYPYYPYYGYHHHNNNNYNSSAAYLVGGLVVGSLLTNAYVHSQVSPAYPATVVVAPQGRRLLRDLNGNCYERTIDGAGNELRTELPPSECNW